MFKEHSFEDTFANLFEMSREMTQAIEEKEEGEDPELAQRVGKAAFSDFFRRMKYLKKEV